MTGAAHTGAQYVRAITARDSDRRARAAFRELVLRLVPPGGTLLDFGAGAGLDARYFAERGFTVRAYDTDPRMCAFLAHHCRELIAGGRIELETGSYADFLARARRAGDPGVAAVTANFAPLNLVRDLPPLFAAFHALTAQRGAILASVLNPYHVGDARYRWWWRNLPRLWRRGCYALPGAQGEIVRRTPADFAAQCAPSFTLERLFTGLPPRSAREAAGNAWPGECRHAWLRLRGSRFMFLLFRKSGY